MHMSFKPCSSTERASLIESFESREWLRNPQSMPRKGSDLSFQLPFPSLVNRILNFILKFRIDWNWKVWEWSFVSGWTGCQTSSVVFSIDWNIARSWCPRACFGATTESWWEKNLCLNFDWNNYNMKMIIWSKFWALALLGMVLSWELPKPKCSGYKTISPFTFAGLLT